MSRWIRNWTAPALNVTGAFFGGSTSALQTLLRPVSPARRWRWSLMLVAAHQRRAQLLAHWLWSPLALIVW